MMAEAALPILVYSLFGLLLAVVWTQVGWVSAVLVLLPLVVARWVFAQFAAQREAYEATIRSLIQAVETKDAYTRGHSERVARASVMIGRAIGMRDERIRSLRYAGTLHDVGKLGVPTRVLQKAGRLTDDEFAAIQLHPVRGREITRELDFLGEAVEGIYHHHERLDGRGYPLGLTGDQIPEFARVIAVADAFDSMTTTRSYRGARSVADAVEELIRCKGTQFDPGMVDALVAAIRQVGWAVESGPPPIVDTGLFGDRSEPSFGSDDDDPTAAEALAAHRPAAARPRAPGGGGG
jgi:HD-GYP domain-containing protein (c-di-GMP phosphodiesterase class II)